MDFQSLKKDGFGFTSGSTNQKYKTDLSDNLVEIPLEPIDNPEIVKSFRNGTYKTIRTIKRVVLYRVYGRRYKEDKGAGAIGTFSTTEFAES